MSKQRSRPSSATWRVGGGGAGGAGGAPKWIRQHPQAIEQGDVMPELGVRARDAHDIAAHLDTPR